MQIRVLLVFSFLAQIAACGGTEGSLDSGPDSILPNGIVEQEGCNGTTLLAGSQPFSEAGPWPVGARTVQIGDLIGEVWYPSELDSTRDMNRVVYDIRKQLDPEEGEKISDDQNPWHICDCFRGAPLDTARGKYPVIVFVHGTAGFRHQSLSFMTHWASYGFVVAALDHPGLKLGDMLAFRLEQNLQSDVDNLVRALDDPSGDLAFLSGSIDMTRMAVAGHSAGGQVARSWGDRAQVLIPMAASGTEPGAQLKSSLILGGMEDGVADFRGQEQGYEQTTGTKRLVGLSDAGHLAFSDLCLLGAADGGLVQIAQDAGVSGAGFASFLWDGCDTGNLQADVGIEIVNVVTTSVLSEVLQCRANQTNSLSEIRSIYSDVGEYLQSLE